MWYLTIALGLVGLVCSATADDADLAPDSAVLSGSPETLRRAADRTPDRLLHATERELVLAAGLSRIDREPLRATLARAQAEVAQDSPELAERLAELHSQLEHMDPAMFSSLQEETRALEAAIGDRAFNSALTAIARTAAIAETHGLHAHAWSIRVRKLEVLAELYREDDVARHADILFEQLEGTPFRIARAEVLARRAQSEHARGALEQSWRTIGDSLEIARDYPDSKTLAFAADEAGWIAHGRAAHGVAIDRFVESAAAARAAGDFDRLARALRSLGLMLENIGRVEEAIARLDEAMVAAHTSKRAWRIADTAMHVADMSHRRGRADHAQRHLRMAEQSILSLPVGDPWMESRRLRLRFEIEDPGVTERARLRAEADQLLSRVPTRDRYPLLQLLAADARRHGEHASALDRARQLVLAAEAIGDSATRRALNTLAHCQYDTGDLEDALHSTETALLLAEGLRENISDLRMDHRMVAGRSSRRHATFATRIAAELHDRWIAKSADGDASAARDYAERALLFLDFGRSRALLEELNDAADVRLTLRPLGLRTTDWRTLREEILGPRDLVLAYDLTAQVAIAATRHDIRLVRLPDIETIERGIDFAHHALRDISDASLYSEPAGRVASALLAPFHDLLAKTDRILCLPSGPMHRLPLELLPIQVPSVKRGSPYRQGTNQKGASDPPDFARFPFLFRSHVVEYVPSLGSIVRFDPDHDVPDRALILAHTAADGHPAIPMVETEAKVVAKLFGSPRTAITRVGPSAQEAALKQFQAKSRDLLHLAAHAWAEPERGVASGIRLAEGDGEDGRLLVDEIMALDLPITLAVVSGCDTGSGESFGADGVLSVGFALIAAGARATLVTVDPVEDHIPVVVLRPFYKRIIAGDDPARALAAARRELIASNDSTKRAAAIAPFVIVGRYGGPTH